MSWTESSLRAAVLKYAPTLPRFCPDIALYDAAVTPGRRDFERLEFIGDAVIYAVTAAYLFARYSDQNEGFMTRVRTRIVNGCHLAELCRKATPIPSMLPARSEAVLEDAFEAFVGALFTDAGFDAVREWLVGVFEAHVDFAQLVSHQNCPKDRLHRVLRTPARFEQVKQEGGTLAHVRVVTADGRVLAEGKGDGKRAAELDAAKNALMYLGHGE